MKDSPTVLHAREPITTVSSDLIGKLKGMALNAPLKRARLCLHLSTSDTVQEMVIALHETTYIRPHRHPTQSESFHMIEGSVLVAFFDDQGRQNRLSGFMQAKTLFFIACR